MDTSRASGVLTIVRRYSTPAGGTLFQIGNLVTGFRIELAAGSALAYFAAHVLAALCFSVRRGTTKGT